MNLIVGCFGCYALIAFYIVSTKKKNEASTEKKPKLPRSEGYSLLKNHE
jgi:hypothetical protein